ncbi:MAG: hypothetical protein KGI54_05310 [Pseudomonadota bacterium]|nr:hypothetical protein [Pseudomonadota bacterium]
MIYHQGIHHPSTLVNTFILEFNQEPNEIGVMEREQPIKKHRPETFGLGFKRSFPVLSGSRHMKCLLNRPYNWIRLSMDENKNSSEWVKM